MYIKYGPKYIMKHSQQNKLSNETKPPHTYSQNNSKAPKFLKDLVISWFFHLRLVVSFKTRKGKQGSKGLSKSNTNSVAYPTWPHGRRPLPPHSKKLALSLTSNPQGTIRISLKQVYLINIAV